MVTVTDVNGCMDTSSVMFTEPDSLTIAASISSNYNGQDLACYGTSTGSATVQVAGGTTAYTYLWSNGSTNITISGVTNGTYTATVTDSNGCSGTGSIVFNSSAIALTMNQTNIDCYGAATGTVGVTVNSGVPPFTYLWSTGDTIPSISGNISGLYWVSTTVNGCTSSDSGMATVLVSPIVDLGKDTTICNTESYTLDAGSGPNFTWNTGATTQSIVVNTSGTYSVIVENAQG